MDEDNPFLRIDGKSWAELAGPPIPPEECLRLLAKSPEHERRLHGATLERMTREIFGDEQTDAALWECGLMPHKDAQGE